MKLSTEASWVQYFIIIIGLLKDFTNSKSELALEKYVRIAGETKEGKEIGTLFSVRVKV